MPKKKRKGNRSKNKRDQKKRLKKLRAVATMIEEKGMDVQDIADFMARRGMGKPSPEGVWKLYREYLKSDIQGKQFKAKPEVVKVWRSKTR